MRLLTVNITKHYNSRDMLRKVFGLKTPSGGFVERGLTV